MNTIKYNKANVKTIAHRGVSGIECENTNAAFVAAGNRSYFGIETDIHVTKDGVFAVIHDDTTARVSDREVHVEKKTYDEISDIRLKTDDGYSRNDYLIPTLSEYIGICKRYEKTAVLELKNHFMPEDIKRAVKIIESMDYINNVIFISFDYDNIVELRRILPNQKLQYLVTEYNEDVLEKLLNHKLDIDIFYKALNKDIVKILHANGIEINCWTCDEKNSAEKIAEMGVDYITTNILE